MEDRLQAVRMKLENELAEVRHELEVELPLRIEEARKKGDLSENAEYAEAKHDQAFIEGRILELESVLRNSMIIEEDVKSEKGVVSVGSKIKIKQHAGTDKPADHEYHIVGSHEADPSCPPRRQGDARRPRDQGQRSGA